MNLFARKDISQLIADAHDSHGDAGHGHAGAGSPTGLKRHLSAFSLTMLGIGCIIGAGIFSLTGHAAAQYAGPGIVYAFILGGILCGFAGLCYAELAAMIPVSGSAYAYSYATMGELVAWIIGWDLILEYGFACVTVADAWSGYAYSVVHKTLGFTLPEFLVRLTKGPFEQVTLASGEMVSGLWNLPATFISLVVMGVLYRGIRESAAINTAIVILKTSIICIFIALGIGLIDSSNLFVNGASGDWMALVPAPELVKGEAHFGWGSGGVLTAAGVLFFAYIGFDAVSTTSQEAKNPKRDVPIGILASLVICTVLYILVGLVLTGVVHYSKLGVPDPIAVGIDRIVELRGWDPTAGKLFTLCIKLGALAGLSSVILVSMLGQTRIFYAMARDGLLPWFDKLHPKYQTPHVATLVTGTFIGLCSAVMPMHIVGEVVSIGTLLAFALVCLSVPILRVTMPNAERPFKIAGGMFGAVAVGLAGAGSCLFVMSGLPSDTWLRLIVWLAIGFVVYFAYGMKNSRLQRRLPARV